MEKIVGNEGHLAYEAGLQLQRCALEALEARGALHLAVCGGSVAALVFPVFAQVQLDWSRTHVWFVDERVVPLTHADSNFKMASELWLSKVPAVAHPFTSADEYQRTLPRPLDVALLGVGPDGHVASLFPGHPALDQRARRALEIDDSPKPPPRRLTLGLDELTAAREVWVMALGMTKAQMMMRALRPDSPLPVARVLREAKGARLWLDAAAATYL